MESLKRVFALGRKDRPRSVHSEDMIKVQSYEKKDCHLCLVATETLARVRAKIPFELQEIDIESSRDLYADFREKIPVVFIDGKRAFTYKINEGVSLFANLGQWLLEEQKSTESDPALLAYQLGTVITPSKSVEFKLGAGFYDYLKLHRYAYDEDDLNDVETFIGYNNNTQQMVFDSEGNLLNEFGVLEVQAQAKFKDIIPVPFSVFGSYISNLDADIDRLTRDGIAYPDTDPADLLAYGGDDRDTGWLIGFDLGNKKKKGDWYFKYWYQVLEDYAFPAVFVDSDFHGGGTYNKGHKIHGRYYFTGNIYAQATGYLTEREDERKDGLGDEDRIQLDAIFKF